jgi:S-adenosylmethionine/arginine decarboxylase-like enzyme
MGQTRKRSSGRGTRKVKPYWGYHLIVNAGGCDAEAIRSPKTIKAFTKDLVKRIDMKAFGEPRVVRFGQGDILGYSMVQLIETSDITAHFVEPTNDMYLDVFSCKKFNPSDALKVIREWIKPTAMETKFIKRRAP